METFKYNKDDPKAVDEAYQKWINEHQKDGWVLNVAERANGTPSKIKMHDSRCDTLNAGNDNLIDGSGVRKGITKICSTSKDELITWAKQQECGWDWCGRC